MEEEDLVFAITIRLLHFSLEITVVISDDPALGHLRFALPPLLSIPCMRVDAFLLA